MPGTHVPVHRLPVLEFGPPGPVRDALVNAILDGAKRGSSNLAVVHELWAQPVPEVGERRALLDSSGARVAVVEYTEVRRLPFAAITEEIAAEESITLPLWQDQHRAFWASLIEDIRSHLGDPTWSLTDDEEVVSAAFTVSVLRPSLGVIGAGFHSSTNILPSLSLAGVTVDALATRDVQRSRDTLRRIGSDGTAYGSAAELLGDASVTDVVVVAQPRDQIDLVLDAVAAGKNVFVDKPLGWTSEEARRIAEAADAAGTLVMVGFMKRYAPAYVQLAELIGRGDLGTVRSFDIVFGCDSTPFCATEEDFVKLAAIHLIDLARFLFGETAGVTALSNSDGANVALTVAVSFRSGVVGTLSLSGLPGYSSETEQVRVTGDDGYAIVTDVAQLVTHRRQTGAPASWRSLTETTTVHSPAASAMSGVEQHLYLRGFVGEMLAFQRAARTGVAPSSSAADNVGTMEFCEQILESAAGR